MSKPAKFTSLADLAALTGAAAPAPSTPQGSDLVYSTDGGRISAPAEATRAIPDGSAVRVRREKQGRGGKVVTTISGLPLDDAALKVLLKELKHGLGGGGTVKDGVVEIQGDHRDRLVELLKQRGYAAKAAGG